MAMMGLMCPAVLSNSAFLITTALQCGMKIPYSLLPYASNHAALVDPFGHNILNAATQPQRITSHDVIVKELTATLNQVGLVASANARCIPRADDSTAPNKHGDILVSTHGICAGSSFANTAQTVLDVSLVHSTHPRQGRVIFDPRYIQNAELTKNRKYETYRRLQIGFGPIIVDTTGRIGEHALVCFDRLAQVLVQSHQAVESASCAYIYHKLRLTLLVQGLEATSSRFLSTLQKFAANMALSNSPNMNMLGTQGSPSFPLNLPLAEAYNPLQRVLHGNLVAASDEMLGSEVTSSLIPLYPAESSLMCSIPVHELVANAGLPDPVVSPLQHSPTDLGVQHVGYDLGLNDSMCRDELVSVSSFIQSPPGHGTISTYASTLISSSPQPRPAMSVNAPNRAIVDSSMSLSPILAHSGDRSHGSLSRVPSVTPQACIGNYEKTRKSSQIYASRSQWTCLSDPHVSRCCCTCF